MRIMNLTSPHAGLDLRRRRRQPELMDDPALDPAEHAAALRGLARINAVSQSASILWTSLRDLARSAAPRPLRVLDVATGGGDVPLALARHARASGVRLELHACDISATAIAEAGQRGREAGVQMRLFECDALALPAETTYDAVICSLFVHHLEEDAVVLLLERMCAAAEQAVLVSDLRRSFGGYLMACAATRALTRSRIVHVDGPRSVEGAFTPEELRDLAARAGLTGATVEPRWPCRMLLRWRRP
jgi:2-polyprenyl-3-methyl-5-hydroxy-6-metoxy-1,4-benzoquinol methylase